MKVPNVKPYQMKPKQTRRQKREEKNFEMQSPVELVNDKPRDKQIKRIKKKLQKVKKKIKKLQKAEKQLAFKKKFALEGVRKFKAHGCSNTKSTVQA